MRILALASRPIESMYIGYDLRVANLCRQLQGEVHLLVAPLCEVVNPAPSISPGAIFDSVETLEPLLAGRLSWRRHLRLSDDAFLRRAAPAAFAAAKDRVEAIVRHREIDRVVVFGGDLADLVSSIDPRIVVLDVCDSRSLTARRALRRSARRPRGVRMLSDRLALHRIEAMEARLPARFKHLSTISEPDSREISRLHGSSANVHTIPNGVGESFLAPLPPAGQRRGIAFWGNLAFAPNADAMWYLVHDVYLPHLRAAGVELFVAGANAPSWLTELSTREPGLVVAGFVEDLAGAVGRYPIMINPMRIGSGLKNKVLEAFGLGLVVVSTPLGIEALTGVRDGSHAIVAAAPADLAGAVLDLLADAQRIDAVRRSAKELLREHYSWDVIGREWRTFVCAEAQRRRCADDAATID